MSIRPRTHALAEAKHSMRRVEERYGTHLTKHDISEIGKIIMSPNKDNKVFLHQQEDGCSHWLVRYNGTVYRTVFDERQKTTRTFMEMQPIHDKIWNDSRDNAGRPTLGDHARITKLKLR